MRLNLASNHSLGIPCSLASSLSLMGWTPCLPRRSLPEVCGPPPPFTHRCQGLCRPHWPSGDGLFVLQQPQWLALHWPSTRLPLQMGQLWQTSLGLALYGPHRQCPLPVGRYCLQTYNFSSLSFHCLGIWLCKHPHFHPSKTLCLSPSSCYYKFRPISPPSKGPKYLLLTHLFTHS